MSEEDFDINFFFDKSTELKIKWDRAGEKRGAKKGTHQSLGEGLFHEEGGEDEEVDDDESVRGAEGDEGLGRVAEEAALAEEADDHDGDHLRKTHTRMRGASGGVKKGRLTSSSTLSQKTMDLRRAEMLEAMSARASPTEE